MPRKLARASARKKQKVKPAQEENKGNAGKLKLDTKLKHLSAIFVFFNKFSKKQEQLCIFYQNIKDSYL